MSERLEREDYQVVYGVAEQTEKMELFLSDSRAFLKKENLAVNEIQKRSLVVV